jgi:hypothetical protein
MREKKDLKEIVETEIKRLVCNGLTMWMLVRKELWRVQTEASFDGEEEIRRDGDARNHVLVD